MSICINVAFQGMPPSPALRSDIEARVERLMRLAPRLQACDVVVRHSEQRHGKYYQVHVHLTFPVGELEAGKTPHADYSHDDPYLAVRDTFDALHRQLDDNNRTRGSDTTTHSSDSTSPFRE
jgi:ribosomal subunit interface protein